MTDKYETLKSYGVLFKGPLNINTTPIAELMDIPYITNEQAKLLLEYREDHGPISDIYELDFAINSTPDRLYELYREAGYESPEIIELPPESLEEALTQDEIDELKAYFNQDTPSGLDDIQRRLDIVSPTSQKILDYGYRFIGPPNESLVNESEPGEPVTLSVFFRDVSGDFINVDDPTLVSVLDPEGDEHLPSDLGLVKRSHGVYETEFMVPSDGTAGKWSYTVEGDYENGTISRVFHFIVSDDTEVQSFSNNNVCVVTGSLSGYSADEPRTAFVHFQEKSGRFDPYRADPIEVDVNTNGRFQVELIQGAKVRFDLPGSNSPYIVTIPNRPAVEFQDLIESDYNG